jgi:hypothetical protein
MQLLAPRTSRAAAGVFRAAVTSHDEFISTQERSP